MNKAYEVLTTHDLPEYRGKGLYLLHKKSGAKVYKIECADRENLFSFAFKTPPADSRGVAHILEHSVLCGSRKYPLKDPFLHLLKGSLNTFLNAMTFPDKTVYPAASVVKEDYFHLMDVYGDAVFFPLLKEEIFRQEGHRLEEDPQSGRLKRVGVVYNEMKGNYSSQDSVAQEYCVRSLYPGTTYSHDSGGDPREIPRLTYQEFLDFHRRHYHPSNALIFLYGNIALEEELAFLDEHFLKEFDLPRGMDEVSARENSTIPIHSLIAEQGEPSLVEVEETWPADRADENTALLMNWKLGDITDQKENLLAQIGAEILLGHDGAPLQKALVESPLGEDLSPVTGLELDLRDVLFTVGIRGAEASQKGAFQDLVFQELTALCRRGIPEEWVSAAIDQVEFRNREIAGGGPFGLRLMIRSLRGWVHGADPARTLGFNFWMEQVKAEALKPGFWENYFRTRLLENPRRSLVVIKPDTEQEGREAREQETLMEELARRMSDEDREALRKEQEALKAFQKRPDDPRTVAALPLLKRESLPKKVQVIEQDFKALLPRMPGGEVLFQPIFSNGVLYLNIAFDVTFLAEEEKQLLPLLTRALWGVGAEEMTYDVLTHKLSRCFGGAFSQLDASHLLDEAPPGVGRGKDKDRRGEFFFIRTKFLPSRAGEALDLLKKILQKPRFDRALRLKDVLLEFRNDYRSSLVPSGHHYTTLRAVKDLTPSLCREDQWHGIGQFLLLDRLAENWSEKLAGELGEALAGLARRIFFAGRCHVSVTGSRELFSPVKETLKDFLSFLCPSPSSAGAGPAAGDTSPLGALLAPLMASEADEKGRDARVLKVPAAVGFAAAGFPAWRINSPRYISATLAAQLLKTGYLWETIRMEGGAYGAFASLAPLEGVFSLATYRDPQPRVSLQVFQEAFQSLARSLTSEDVYRSIISTLGSAEKPLSPSERGIIGLKRHLYGVTPGVRQNNRDALMKADMASLKETLHLLEEMIQQKDWALLGGGGLLEGSSEEPYPLPQ